MFQRLSFKFGNDIFTRFKMLSRPYNFIAGKFKFVNDIFTGFKMLSRTYNFRAAEYIITKFKSQASFYIKIIK